MLQIFIYVKTCFKNIFEKKMFKEWNNLICYIDTSYRKRVLNVCVLNKWLQCYKRYTCEK
jgi:hypothetical protein